MIVLTNDSQIVGETQSTLFSVFQSGSVDMLVITKNSGVNVMTFRWQYYNGSAWVDLGASGSDYYNTLSPNEVRTVKIASAYPQIQFVGSASGGAFLEFSVQRYFQRSSGGPIPILNL